MISRFIAAGMAGLSVLLGRAIEPSLIPERFSVTPGATLQLDLFGVESSEAKISAGRLVGSDRVRYAFFRLGNENSEIRRFEPDDRRISFSVQVHRPGWAVVAVGLKPIIVEMGLEGLEEYLRDLHLSGLAKAELTSKVGQRQWRTSLQLHAKVFVRVGLPVEADREWERPSGSDFELIPEVNPASLQVGKALPVRVLYNGAAVANMAVNFRTLDGAYHHVAYTDADGHAEATLAAAGKWLVYGTILESLRDGGGIDLAVEMTTLAVEVR